VTRLSGCVEEDIGQTPIRNRRGLGHRDCALRLGNRTNRADDFKLVLSLTAPHDVVEIQDVRLDLIVHPVFGQMAHLYHLEYARWISLAPFD
jgi:hypothetical protein